jgi:hypothetical protein
VHELIGISAALDAGCQRLGQAPGRQGIHEECNVPRRLRVSVCLTDRVGLSRLTRLAVGKSVCAGKPAGTCVPHYTHALWPITVSQIHASCMATCLQS